MVPIPFVSPEDGFKLVIESMANGSKAMHGMPIFYLPEGLLGTADIIEKANTHGSVFGEHHYIIKEIKLAKNIRDEHVIQGAFYNYILGKIQGFTPRTFYIINRDGEEIPFRYSAFEKLLLEAIEGTRKILRGDYISPTYGSCDFPWEGYCNRMAEKTNDISLIPGLHSLKTKNKLVAVGFNTVKDLAEADIERLVEIDGIGVKKATSFVHSAKAIQSGKPIVKDRKSITLPSKKTEIFLDLEGTDPTMAGDEIIQVNYLIGALVRIDSKATYIPFVAKDLDHEKEMLLEFIDFVKGQTDYVIYHYHHYEKTHLNKMMAKHKIDGHKQSIILDKMLDVYKIANDSVAFPTYGTGLKDVARHLGFGWRHKEVNATESIAMYLDYIADQSANKEKLRLILDYNEDDCNATRVIKDWLETVRVG
jgi:uncharacterized protein